MGTMEGNVAIFVTIILFGLAGSIELEVGEKAEFKTGTVSKDSLKCDSGSDSSGKTFTCGGNATGEGDLGAWNLMKVDQKLQFTVKGDSFQLPEGKTKLQFTHGLSIKATKSVNLTLEERSEASIGYTLDVFAVETFTLDVQEKSKFLIGASFETEQENPVKLMLIKVARNGSIIGDSHILLRALSVNFQNSGTIKAGSKLELQGGKEASKYVFTKGSSTQSGDQMAFRGGNISMTIDASISSGNSLEVGADNTTFAAISKNASLSSGFDMMLNGNKVALKNDGNISTGGAFTACSKEDLDYEMSGNTFVSFYAVFGNEDKKPLRVLLKGNANLTVGMYPESPEKLKIGENDLTLLSGKSVSLEYEGSKPVINVQGSLNITAPEIKLKNVGSLCVQKTLILNSDNVEITYNDNSNIVVGKLEVKGEASKVDTRKITVKEDVVCDAYGVGNAGDSMIGLFTCEDGRPQPSGLAIEERKAFAGPGIQANKLGALTMMLVYILA